MTKKLLALAIVLGVAATAFATPKRDTPSDKRGDPISHPLYGGSEVKYLTGTSADMACTGKCLLLGVTMETGASTTLLLLRNTITADNIFVANHIPYIHFQPDTYAHKNPIAFPTVFSAGISVDISAAGAGVAVHYIDLDD